MTIGTVIASALTEPLEVAAVVMTFSFFYGGFASAVALWRGAPGSEVADAAARGAAAGFVIGMFAGAAAALYVVIE